jgi:hypothetical protein
MKNVFKDGVIQRLYSYFIMAIKLHNPIDWIVPALVSEFGQATDNEVKWCWCENKTDVVNHMVEFWDMSKFIWHQFCDGPMV